MIKSKALSAAAALALALPMVATTSAAASTAPLPCSPAKVDALTYRGGDVITDDDAVDLIFWGSWWKTSPKAPARISELKALFTGLSESAWANTVTQYCYLSNPAGPVAPSTFGLLGDTVIDQTNPPAAPTDQQITKEVAKKFRFDQDYHVPMVVTPPGVTPQQDAANGWCGHHGWGSVPDPPVTNYYAWADVPYGVIASSSGCQPDGSPAEGLSDIAGHEWAEAVTDPYPNGGPGPVIHTAWAATTSAKHSVEIADLCEPDQVDFTGHKYGTFKLTLSTGTFVMQRLWSNEAGPSSLQGACVKGSP
jgi:hypothetical protein